MTYLEQAGYVETAGARPEREAARGGDAAKICTGMKPLFQKKNEQDAWSVVSLYEIPLTMNIEQDEKSFESDDFSILAKGTGAAFIGRVI